MMKHVIYEINSLESYNKQLNIERVSQQRWEFFMKMIQHKPAKRTYKERGQCLFIEKLQGDGKSILGAEDVG